MEKLKKYEVWVDGDILMMKLSGVIMPEDIEDIAKKGLALAKKSGTKYNLIDISCVKSVPLSTRNAAASSFSGPAKKIAFVCNNPVARIIGSFFLRRYKIAIPIKLFSSAEEARKWFREKE
jgi:hypothetical protein